MIRPLALALPIMLDFIPPYRHIMIIYRHDCKADLVFNDKINVLLEKGFLTVPMNKELSKDHPLSHFYVCSKIMTSHREGENDDFVLMIKGEGSE